MFLLLQTLLEEVWPAYIHYIKSMSDKICDKCYIATYPKQMSPALLALLIVIVSDVEYS